MIRIALMFPAKGFFTETLETFKLHGEFKNDFNINDLVNDYELVEICVPNNKIKKEHIDNVDVIISRGITAELIKKQVGDIPVVEIPVVGNDLVRCLNIAKNKFGNRRTGVIGSQNMIYGVEALSDIVDMDIQAYIRHKTDDYEELVDRAIVDGCQTIIGGIESCRYATKKGMNNLIIKTAKEALWQAFTEAKKVAQIHMIEQKKARRFEAVLNYTSEGIIEINEENKIVVCNNMARTILDLNKNCIGQNLSKVLSNELLHNLIIVRQECVNELVELANYNLMINVIPLIVKNDVKGKIITLGDITKVQQMERTIRKKLSQKGYIAKKTFEDVLGRSKTIDNAKIKAKIFAKAESDVLIIGASGTGKEVFAQSMHNYSIRANHPFVAINCAAIQTNLLESELFGYAEGAFTGATKGGKIGLFEQSHGGTLFLDEIAEIPMELQSKLLRVIQEREVMRLGDDKIIPIDIKIIAATNKNLYEYVKKGTFREDLYYRLDVLMLKLPTLDERVEDIPIIAEYFIKKFCTKNNIHDIILSEDAKKLLVSVKWPGNIRQLKNICTRAVILNNTQIITEKDITSLLDEVEWLDVDKNSVSSKKINNNILNNNDFSLDEKGFKENKIKKALEDTNYNRTEAAKLLGISRTTLWKIMNEHK